MKKEIREKKLTKTREDGAVATIEIGMEGTIKIGIVDTAETGVVGTADTGATGVAYKMKENRSEKVTQIHMCKGNLTKKRGKDAYTQEFSLGVNTLLFIRIKNLLPYGRLIVRILKNVLKSLRRQVCIRPTCSRRGNGRRGNHQRRTILHSLR